MHIIQLRDFPSRRQPNPPPGAAPAQQNPPQAAPHTPQGAALAPIVPGHPHYGILLLEYLRHGSLHKIIWRVKQDRKKFPNRVVWLIFQCRKLNLLISSDAKLLLTCALPVVQACIAMEYPPKDHPAYGAQIRATGLVNGHPVHETIPWHLEERNSGERRQPGE